MQHQDSAAILEAFYLAPGEVSKGTGCSQDLASPWFLKTHKVRKKQGKMFYAH
jgi:hypothetical protein